jgi:hypothetical protein
VVGSEPADLNDIEHNVALVNRAIGRLGGLDTALIAHGLLGDQRVTEQNWSAAEEVLSTNLASPMSLLMPLAEHFESQGSAYSGRGAPPARTLVPACRGAEGATPLNQGRSYEGERGVCVRWQTDGRRSLAQSEIRASSPVSCM